jgi:DNA-binding NtrC family response regulator
MSVKLFAPEDAIAAEALAEIPYVNPFSREREVLERRVLGEAYLEPVRFLLPGEPLHRLEGNLGALVARAEALLGGVAVRLERGVRPAAAEVETVEGLAHFVVFHRHARAFDGLPGVTEVGAHEGLHASGSGSAGRTSAHALFERCRKDLEILLGHPALGLDVAGQVGTWFALYHQIRRAWVHTFAFLRGGSAAMRALRERIWESVFTHDMRRYRRSLHARMGDITTLITGPSGSGKELVARAIGLSRFVPYDVRERCFAAGGEGSFYPLNLSALSPTLIESELFGHRRGAFTGALADRAGYFETCGAHGTVFLDEVGETAGEIQVKLLRVLQTRQFNRLGDTELRAFRGRVVAATNRDLAVEMAAGRFREDFYFRLCGDRIETPALRDVLRDEPEELECLVAHVCAAQAGVDEAPRLAGEVLSVVRGKLGRGYPWPGNFRELEQCVRHVLVHGDYEPQPTQPVHARGWLEEARRSRLTMDALLREYCRQVVDESGSLEEAARRLEVDRRTVRRYANETSNPDEGRGG